MLCDMRQSFNGWRILGRLKLLFLIRLFPSRLRTVEPRPAVVWEHTQLGAQWGGRRLRDSWGGISAEFNSSWLISIF